MSYFEGSGPKLIPDFQQTFLADSGYTSPAVGDPVYVSGDNKVSLCVGANPAFVGFVQAVIPADPFGNKLLNVYVFGHRLRCKNTSGSPLTAGMVITSGNAGITVLAAVTTLDAAWSSTPTLLLAALNAQNNRRGVVVVGGANNAQVQIIFG